MKKFKSVDELISQLQPDKPVYCIRKKSIQVASRLFQEKFPGKILYAVKTNPHKEVLKTIIQSGIKQFDVASVEEIKTIKQIDPNLNCSYMHTVKSRENIKEAYFNYGIKDFSLENGIEFLDLTEHIFENGKQSVLHGPMDWRHLNYDGYVNVLDVITLVNIILN